MITSQFLLASRPLTSSEREESQARHACYYRILDCLISTIRNMFGRCMVLDLHSYCWQIRTYPFAPVFNTGVSQLKLPHWEVLLDEYEDSLKAIEIPGVETTLGRNTVFQGKAWQARHIGMHHPDVPVIPLEIKKIYMDELTGELYPEIIESIGFSLQKATKSAANRFAQLPLPVEIDSSI